MGIVEQTRDGLNKIERSSSPPRLLVIGAGSRGNAYARAVKESTDGIIVAVAEPLAFQRQQFGQRYIWGNDGPKEGQEFSGWREFVDYELQRRQLAESGKDVPPGVDGIFVCTLDTMHEEIIIAFAPLNLHVMSEKPLATTMQSCLNIYRALRPKSTACSPGKVFSVGHVLRYSPHNMLLYKLLLEERAIGDIVSIEHTEPVGWWHFSHSYVRGHWRKESTTAPSLLTKSCHDVDLLLWLLCSPPGRDQPLHLPSSVSSSGSLKYFKRSRKPALAGEATNCLSCPAEPECLYSAKKIYNERHLQQGKTGWPVKIVVPEIEDCLRDGGPHRAEAKLMDSLGEDYDINTSTEEVDSRSWFGRCVYEAGNDVCDDQYVTITWEDDPLPSSAEIDAAARLKGRGAKTATLHMIAFTEKICERRGRVYGTQGELEYDSEVIRVHNFLTGQTQTHHPHQPGGGHGGGDDGLAMQYVKAIDAVKNEGMSAEEAQTLYLGCSLEDVIRSHAMVFAAEDARRGKQIVDWETWWEDNVNSSLHNR